MFPYIQPSITCARRRSTRPKPLPLRFLSHTLLPLLVILPLCAHALEKTGRWDLLKVSYGAPTPTSDFARALPIGNGRLGAKIYGGVANELFDLNDVYLWSGAPTNLDNAAKVPVLKAVRASLAAGNYIEASRTAAQLNSGNPESESFQPLGSIKLAFDGVAGATNYSRVLDMDQATVTVKYTVGGVNYTRETFASTPDQVIVTRISASQNGKVSLTAHMDTQLQGKVALLGHNEIVVTGRAPIHVLPKIVWDPTKGIEFESHLRVINQGGTVTTVGNDIKVAGANSVVLLFSSLTSYNGYDKDPATQGVDPTPAVTGYINQAAARSYDDLLSRHLTEYRSQFRRLWVELNGNPLDKDSLQYQWSRYLLLQTSRGNPTRPRNEQGIWNRDVQPHYKSNYTLNENPEKYYALAEPANIAETVNPLISLVADMAKKGAGTAKTNYGFRGWVAHHNSDVWAMTVMAPGSAKYSAWPVGGLWLSSHVWEHYAFSHDLNYLRNTGYPILKGAALFALDLLVDDGKGHLVTSPSTSPENQFISPEDRTTAVPLSRGSTMDMALVGEVFENCLEAIDALGIATSENAFRAELKNAHAKLLPFRVGSSKQLQEWSEDFTEFEPTHRHASHLISVWPLRQITKDSSPSLFAAALESEILRGSGGYHPDKAGMYARLLDAERAYASLQRGFPVMYDNPFGGFGELLLQSHTGHLDILPALPKAWAAGKISGIRARGGYELDIEWEGNKMTKTVIRSVGTAVLPPIRVQGVQVDPFHDARITLVK